MRKRMINEAALPRIRRNISKLSMKILAVANPMLVEAGLPHLPGKLLPHLTRKATLDALSAAFDGLALGWGQQHMQMFRHDNEPVQIVPPLISIMEESLHKQLCVSCDNE